MSVKQNINIGDKFQTNYSGTCEVVSYDTCKRITVKFATGYTAVCKSSDLYRGKIKDPLAPRVSGKGFGGIGDYSKVSHPEAYQKWENMLDRVYSLNRYPSSEQYENCTMDTDWHNFQLFAKWFYSEKSLYPSCDNLQLDKDLRSKEARGKHYGVATCLLIPQKLNMALVEQNKGNTTGFSGVRAHRNSYVVNQTQEGKNLYFGSYKTAEEASKVSVQVKTKYILDVTKSFGESIPPKILYAVKEKYAYNLLH